MYRRFVSILAAALAAGWPGAKLWAAAQPSAAGPLNILLIVSDDHQHTALGCAGHPVLKTPNLDRLAASGVRFTHAFCEIPICTPSRASYLTGRLGASNGVTFFGMPIHQGMPTWATVLADRGYQTALVGKWHNMRGFDEYGFDWTANVFTAGMGSYIDPLLTQKAGEKPKPVEGEITELITDAAVKFLEKPGDKPFFLYVSYTAPHDPREPPAEYEQMYDADNMPLPPNFRPVPEPDPGTLNIRDEKLLPVPRDPGQVRSEIARYYGLITYMDAQIGRILATLEQRGLAGNTIVIFAGDNGLALGAHGLLGKQTLLEEGVRVPLIVRHPRLSIAGQTRDALVYLMDLMPTTLAWTAAPLPKGVQGLSLHDVYTGRSPAVRDCIFARYDERKDQMFRSIRTDRYKLIQYLKLDREQLFDLRNDPHELNDLSQEPGLQDVRRDLHKRLMDWRREQDRLESQQPGEL